MTTFLDGPAKGQNLMLGRAPDVLRVTECGGVFDALDQIADEPKPNEKLITYERVGTPGRIHCYFGGGRGGWYAVATYKLAANQPTDATMRDTAAWRNWCEVHFGRLPAGAAKEAA